MLKLCLILLGLGLCLLLYLWANRRVLQVARAEIAIPHLPKELEGFTILQVSDLHDCAYGKDGRGLVELMDTLRWDLLAVTGDLFDRHHPERHENALAFVQYATQRGAVWFVEGNHEGKLPQYRESYREKLVQAGVHILDNTSVSMDTHGSRWTLGGVKDGATEMELQQALQGEGFKLLLAHRPEEIDCYATVGANLVLSGHAHGGQWRFFNHGIYSPDQGLFPPYTAGTYRRSNTLLYVSTGAGDHRHWLPRLFNPPHIDLLTLKTE